MKWQAIEALYVNDAASHGQACAAAGLSCPPDVFEQLFHDHHEDRDFASDLAGVDWSRVVWEEQLLSGVRLRQVACPRGYQYAVDEARARTLMQGLTDEREAVLASWREAQTWVRAPVVLEGAVLGLPVALELRVGFTRLGDLLGMLDRGEVPEALRHRVWVGILRA